LDRHRIVGPQPLADRGALGGRAFDPRIETAGAPGSQMVARKITALIARMRTKTEAMRRRM
jgi:hypothetical protein